MSRARQALRCAGGLALVVVGLLWWAPTLLLAVVRWQGGRLRFALLMGFGRGLVALGWPGAASRVFAAEMARAERSLRATGRGGGGGDVDATPPRH